MGELADGHAVGNGNGELANAGLVLHLQDRAVHVSIWVWPVEDQQFRAVLGASFHGVAQCDDLGVETASDILHVENENVDLLEIFFGGLALRAVERYNGNTGGGIDLIGDGSAV